MAGLNRLSATLVEQVGLLRRRLAKGIAVKEIDLERLAVGIEEIDLGLAANEQNNKRGVTAGPNPSLQRSIEELRRRKLMLELRSTPTTTPTSTAPNEVIGRGLGTKSLVASNK